MIYEYSANRPARAKINLMLSVVGRMPNGYHELKSVMHAVPLHDDVIVELAVRTGKDAETAAGATAEQAAPAAGAFAQVAPAAGAFAQVAPAAGAPAVGAPAAMATVAMLAAAAPEAGGASGAGPALAATAPAPAPAAAVAADAAAFADCAYSAPIYARIALTAEYDAHGPGGASTEWAHEPSRAAARDGNGDREHGNAHNGMCNDAHGNMCSDAHGDVRNGSHNGAHCNPRIGAHGNPRTDAYSGPHQALFADIPTDGRNSAVKATRLFLEHCGIKTVRVADEPTSELHAAPLGEPAAAPRTPKTCTKTDATPQPFAPRQPICLDIHIRIVKRIPAAAGLAGGSSDAAATLLALNEIFQSAGMPGATATELMDIAKSVGADVPFCLAGWPAALARGIGEKLEPLPPLPPCVSVVLANPNLPVETAWVFSRYSQRPAKDARETRATSASGTTDATNAD
ncbi:MAG: hypothetical protein LBL83_04500, partial [Clostridiales bacterium]|nr:hypothetical protein [Clostridiales bacterium]